MQLQARLHPVAGSEVQAGGVEIEERPHAAALQRHLRRHAAAVLRRLRVVADERGCLTGLPVQLLNGLNKNLRVSSAINETKAETSKRDQCLGAPPPFAANCDQEEQQPNPSTDQHMYCREKIQRKYRQRKRHGKQYQLSHTRPPSADS